MMRLQKPLFKVLGLGIEFARFEMVGIILVAFVSLAFFDVSATQAADSKARSSLEMARLVRSSSAGDQYGEASRRDLLLIPRIEVLKLADQWLSSKEPHELSLGIKITEILNLEELSPTILKMAAKSSNISLHLLARKYVADSGRQVWIGRYQELLKSKYQTSDVDLLKLVAIETLTIWKAKVDFDIFKNLFRESFLDLRVSAVRLLLVQSAHEQYFKTFGESLNLKPFQARVISWRYLAKLSVADLAPFRSLLTSKTCEDQNSEVSDLCRQVLKKSVRDQNSFLRDNLRYKIWRLLTQEINLFASEGNEWWKEQFDKNDGRKKGANAPSKATAKKPGISSAASSPSKGSVREPVEVGIGCQWFGIDCPQRSSNRPRKQNSSDINDEKIKPSDWQDRFDHQIDHANRKLQDVRKASGACLSCLAPWVIHDQLEDWQKENAEEILGKLDAEGQSSLAKCQEKYEKIYSKPEIDVRLALGYLDSDDRSPVDIYLRAAMIRKLMETCPSDLPTPVSSSRRACGFKQGGVGGDNANILTREVTGPLGKKHTIKLTITQSSTSELGIEAQERQSNESRDNFIDGMNRADVVFYAGHARKGGGPDFDPPKTFEVKEGAKTRRAVDYDYYQARKPGLKAMISSLATAENPPKLIGLFGCDTEKHFGREVRKAAPNSATITTFGIQQFETLAGQIFATIDSLMAQQCEDAFQKSLKKTSFWFDDDDQEPPILTNMF
jgi:hypothetical protein